MKLHISHDVAQALRDQRPVVALESTIISHGMPYPQNFTTALEVEQVVLSNGAVPATIAILQGKIHIGLTSAQLEALAIQGQNCVKCTRSNIPYVTSQKLYGSTTVAATMFLAHKAGIKFFVTGGIGGVHRGAEVTWDVSADLVEMGRTPVCVICAGAKSILDIPKTLEYLETQGVPVVGYQTDEFPAFFSPKSNCRVSVKVENPLQCAQFVRDSENLGLTNGILVGVPLDDSEVAQGVEDSIQQALKEAEEQGIQGARVTPFLLQRINELSEGESLRANIALIKNNAKVGAQISKEFYSKGGQITVIGGLTMDLIGKQNQEAFHSGEAPGQIQMNFGGVGYNIARGIMEENKPVSFITVVGRDGNMFAQLLQSKDINAIKLDDFDSAKFMAHLDQDGKMRNAVAQMEIFQNLQSDQLKEYENLIVQSKFVVMDSNFSQEIIQYIAQLTQSYEINLLIDPTAEWHCQKLNDETILHNLFLLSPNVSELFTILNQKYEDQNQEQIIEAAKQLVDKFQVQNIVLKQKEQGVTWITADSIQSFNATPISTLNDVGSGDAFLAGLAASLGSNQSMEESIRAGIKKAEEFLSS